MFKEALICIAIIISIFTLDKITQDFTQKNTDKLKTNLSNIRNSILEKENKDKLLEEVKTIGEDWEKMYEKMAYFIEHNELEKVKTHITILKSYIDMEDDTMAISTIDETSFIIEHIVEKYKFSLQNVF